MDDAVVHESTASPVVVAVILVSLASLLLSADSSVTRCTPVPTLSAQTDDNAERVQGLPCGSEDREELTEGAEQAERCSISEDIPAL